MNKLYLNTFLILFCLNASTRGGETTVPSVDEIVRRANHTAYYQGKDGSAHVNMTITDAQKRERQREFVILRRDNETADNPTGAKDDVQKFYVYFRRPADVNKTVFMVHKKPGGDDDRWLYQPALDLVKRIAASDKRTSFVGSHFFYEDVSGRSIHDDKHDLIETTQHYYVLKSTPKDTTLVEFASYKLWIHKETFLPIKIEYYDAQGKPIRRLTVLKVEQIQGFTTATQSTMEDLRTGGKTVMTFTNVKYDVGIPDEIFTERYLRSAPREYLR